MNAEGRKRIELGQRHLIEAAFYTRAAGTTPAEAQILQGIIKQIDALITESNDACHPCIICGEGSTEQLIAGYNGDDDSVQCLSCGGAYHI